jgi:hypothetical protein
MIRLFNRASDDTGDVSTKLFCWMLIASGSLRACFSSLMYRFIQFISRGQLTHNTVLGWPDTHTVKSVVGVLRASIAYKIHLIVKYRTHSFLTGPIRHVWSMQILSTTEALRSLLLQGSFHRGLWFYLWFLRTRVTPPKFLIIQT